MAKKVAVVDYNMCDPERCDNGVCIAALECEHGSLFQDQAHETPEVNPAKWCNGCAKCSVACPLKAIRMV